MFVQFGLRGYHAALRLTELSVVGGVWKNVYICSDGEGVYII